MLRVNVQVSASAAKNYYTEALSRQDYYSENQEIIGLWGGKGAAKLGFAEKVERDEFAALCENLQPGTSDNLTPRTKTNRRVGYDFNFHVPKSVSVMQQVVGDPRILQEFRTAVAETMGELEQDMQVRIRRGGSGNRTTGNMVWAEFVHTTSRPVDGVPDCHLHAHCFAFNASFDETENRWKAGEFGNIKKDMEYYEAAFHSRFAGRMAKLGYEIERKGKFWELGGVSPEIVEKYSRRGAQIEAEAEKRGITDPKLKDYLGGYTRERKASADPGIDCLSEWRSRLSAEESRQLAAVHEAALRKSENPEDGGEAAGRGVDYALQHHFQNRSVVEERKLMASALRHSVGRAGVEQVREKLNSREITRVSRTETNLITTEEAIQEEKELLAWVKKAKNARQPFLDRPHKFTRDYFSAGQQAAVRHVLESRDRLVVIRGGAGTGKTTLMQEAIEAITGKGKIVHTFAPTAKARDVLRGDGFAAHTVARLFCDPEQREKIKKGAVLWIDEAGLIGVRNMLSLFRLADEKEAVVIVSGDERQHASVERGDALRIMNTLGDVKPAELVEIQRQKGTYKQAVQAISEGRVGHGLQILEEMGSIHEMNSGEACAAIANRYASALKRQKSALIISPTHREGKRVTDAVRTELKKEGVIGKREWELLRQVNLNWTTAQKGDSNHYEPGLIIQFSQNAKGFSKGDKVVVSGVEQGRIGCGRIAGESASSWIDLAAVEGDRFQVYRGESLKVASGERIRITQGGSGKNGTRLENGSIHVVKSVNADGYLETSTGVKIPHDYGNLAHGYVSTSVAAQGRTVDEVFIAQGTESMPASSREQLYVSASRGREKVEIYTDDKAALFEAVNQSGERVSATELTQIHKKMNSNEDEMTVAAHQQAKEAADKAEAEKRKEQQANDTADKADEEKKKAQEAKDVDKSEESKKIAQPAGAPLDKAEEDKKVAQPAGAAVDKAEEEKKPATPVGAPADKAEEDKKVAQPAGAAVDKAEEEKKPATPVGAPADKAEEDKKVAQPAGAAVDKAEKQQPKSEPDPKLRESEEHFPVQNPQPAATPNSPPPDLDPKILEALGKKGLLVGENAPKAAAAVKNPDATADGAYRGRERSSPEAQAQRTAVLEQKQKGEELHRNNTLAKNMDPSATATNSAPAAPAITDTVKPEGGKTWAEQERPTNQGEQTWTQRIQSERATIPPPPPPEPGTPQK